MAKRKTGYVEIVKNEAGQAFWRIVSANGNELARASETYKRVTGAQKSLEATKKILLTWE